LKLHWALRFSRGVVPNRKAFAMLQLTRLLLLLLTLLTPSVSLAVPVTLNFSGNVDFINGLVGPLPPEVAGLSLGDSIDITLTYDSVTQVGTISAIAEGGQNIATSGPLTLGVADNFPGVGDVFEARGEGISTLVLLLVDPTGMAVSGTAVPTSEVEFALFEGFVFRYDNSGNDWFRASGPVVLAAPTMSGAMLFVLGGLIVASGSRWLQR
jgi:hypothetical protein